MNQCVHSGAFVPIGRALAFKGRPTREANGLLNGSMNNSIYDLVILKKLGVALKPQRAPKILQVFWCQHLSGWLKVNTDGIAQGSFGLAGGGGVFKNCKGFLKGCYAFNASLATAFEAKLLAVMYAIEKARDFDLHLLWLECDSFLVVSFSSAVSKDSFEIQSQLVQLFVLCFSLSV